MGENQLYDFAEDLLMLIQRPSTRADVVPLYATAILYEAFARPSAAKTRWGVVNTAIMARWSPAGLTWIKQRAWQRAEARAKAAVAAQQQKAT